jgi:hypothetical protein
VPRLASRVVRRPDNLLISRRRRYTSMRDPMITVWVRGRLK